MSTLRQDEIPVFLHDDSQPGFLPSSLLVVATVTNEIRAAPQFAHWHHRQPSFTMSGPAQIPSIAFTETYSFFNFNILLPSGSIARGDAKTVLYPRAAYRPSTIITTLFAASFPNRNDVISPRTPHGGCQ
ncbi:MAG: hypothetical protein LBR95_09905 [Azoarcus sp.]|jgi:hypothetical protein|nr:hypothetical protein [Azoarcus sp.]